MTAKRDGALRGRPPFQPTPENRIVVKALASTGTPQEIIAKYIGISVDILVIHFREELANALLTMIQSVARNMVHIATVGKGSAAVRAGFQILGRRADWWAPVPLNVNTDTTVRFEDLDNAREIIAGKLTQLATRNGEIEDPGGSLQ